MGLDHETIATLRRVAGSGHALLSARAGVGDLRTLQHARRHATDPRVRATAKLLLDAYYGGDSDALTPSGPAPVAAPAAAPALRADDGLPCDTEPRESATVIPFPALGGRVHPAFRDALRMIQARPAGSPDAWRG